MNLNHSYQLNGTECIHSDPLAPCNCHRKLPTSPHASSLLSEDTPLLKSPSPEFYPLPSSDSSNSADDLRWKFWIPSSPNFRFLILFLAMMIPFGGHVVKSSMSSLLAAFLKDPEFHLNHAQLGTLQSALSIPNLFMPFIGGLLLDYYSTRGLTLVFLLLTLAGHSLFTIAVSYHSYPYALITRALFGLGQGNTVVSQGRIAAQYFSGHELVFAISICESLHNISGWIAKIYVVPAAKFFGSYVYSLAIGVVVCFISFLCGVIFFRVNPSDESEEELERQRISRERGQQPTLSHSHHHPHAHTHTAPHHHHVHSHSHPTSRLPIGFIILCLLHLIHANAFHLFDYISSDFIRTKYHVSMEKAGELASLTSFAAIFLCPIAGWLLDKYGYKMYVVTICTVLTSIAYVLLAITSVSPVIPLLLLSLSVAFVPTILRSSVVSLIPVYLTGTAYGAYEVMESLGAVVGHTLVGVIVDLSAGDYTRDLLLFASMAFSASILSLILSYIDYSTGRQLNVPTLEINKRQHQEDTLYDDILEEHPYSTRLSPS